MVAAIGRKRSTANEAAETIMDDDYELPSSNPSANSSESSDENVESEAAIMEAVNDVVESVELPTTTWKHTTNPEKWK